MNRKDFLSLNGVMQALDVNYVTLNALIEKGVLIPDEVTSGNYAMMFRKDRLPQIRSLIQQAVL